MLAVPVQIHDWLLLFGDQSATYPERHYVCRLPFGEGGEISRLLGAIVAWTCGSVYVPRLT